MDKRIKYSLNEKRMVVRSVIAGRESNLSAANKLGCHLKTVQRWVGRYKHNGLSGLNSGNRKYTGKFKLKVIRHMLKMHLSLSETAAFFSIPGESTVHLWLKLYRTGGYNALLKENLLF